MIATPGRTRHHPAMRYGPAERLLRLARHLAGTRAGLTLDEMARQIEGSRRTAERLRDSLIAMFPQMDYWDDEARVRRWRLPGSALAHLTFVNRYWVPTPISLQGRQRGAQSRACP
jgi:hypothetical protein